MSDDRDSLRVSDEMADQFPHGLCVERPLHLFSASPDLVNFGSQEYRRHSELTSGLLRQLFTQFHDEGLVMSYTLKDFTRDFVKRHFKELSREELRELLRVVPPEERLADISPEERMAGLPPEERLAGLPLEDRLAGLSAEQIQQYLDSLSSSPSRKGRRKK